MSLPLATNRDLYLFVSQLGVTHAKKRSLEEYLRGLWAAALPLAELARLSLSQFAALLERGFTVEPPPFDAALLAKHRDFESRLHGFPGFEETVMFQIIDLREMAAAGTLDDPQRYFGIDAPRGARWYNFDPATYLECAMAGTFGAWDADDDTGRTLVPGKVAVLDAQGQMHAVDPHDIVEPVQPIDGVDWDQVTDFLCAGQCYE